MIAILQPGNMKSFKDLINPTENHRNKKNCIMKKKHSGSFDLLLLSNLLNFFILLDVCI